MKTFSQSFSPVAASRQSTFSASSVVPGLWRTSVNSLPPMITGVEMPPASSFFQTTFVPVSGSNDVTSGGPS